MRALFLLLLLGSSAAAQAPEGWTRLHAGDGLSHNSVYAVHQDRDGFLWFGTLDGLDRYDGYDVVTHRHDPADPTSLPHNLVRSLHEDADGTLWVGTQNGLARRGPRAVGFERFPAPADSATGDRSVFEIVRDRNGTLWAATAGGLLRFEERRGRFVRVLDGMIHALALDADTLWVLRGSATESAGSLLRVDVRSRRVTGRWRVDTEFGMPLAMALDDAGRPWLTGEGPAVFDRDRVSGGAGNYTTRVVERLASGEVWVGGAGIGVRRCQPDGCTHVLVDPDRPDWVHNYVRAVAQDRSGAVWVGTYGGVYRWDPSRKPFRAFGHRPRDPASLSTPAVSALAEDADGQLWVGSFDGGLDRFDPATGEAERFGVGGPRGDVIGGIWALLIDSRGRLWAGSGRGLSQIDTRTGRARILPAVSEALGGAIVTSLTEDADGHLWAGSFGGLVRVDPATGAATPFPVTGDAQGPSRTVVNVVRADGDHVWLGLPWGGLDRLDRRTGRFEAISLAEGQLAGEATYDLHPDGQGGVWIASVSGLTLARPDGILRHLTTADGLPGTLVYSIQPDADGRLWLGTSRGLARVDPVSGDVATYALSDGIGMMEFNRAARLRMRDGRVWLGGADGIVGFDPEAIRADSRAPDVVLVGVEVATQTGTRIVEIRGLDRLVLGADERSLTVTFSALAFTATSEMRYAYRLDGFDDVWVEAGSPRQARYTALPPGDYTLRVRASSADGVWSDARELLTIEARPWVWETVWFRLLLLLALAAVGVVAYRVRVGRLLGVERLRLRIAGDLHDDLASDLSGIALTTDLLGRRSDLLDTDRQRLADVHDTASDMVDALRDIVWTVDPAHDSIEAFGRRVRIVARRLLEGSPHSVEVDLGLDAGLLPMPMRRELLLILKEALHNAARHADATRIDVRLVRENGGLVLTVQDDGSGFDTDADSHAESRGHGLRSLRARAERIGGTLTIKSRPGKGTCVRLVLPKSREVRARRWTVPWFDRTRSS